MNIEIIRNTLNKAYLEDFYAFCQKIGAGLTPQAFQEFVTSGKIRHVGVSNYTVSQFDALQTHLPFPIASHQPEFSCWKTDPLRDGVLDQCMQHGVAPLAWSPLAGGQLCLPAQEVIGLDRGEHLANLIEVLDRIAAEQSQSREAVALSWLLAHPAGVIPIIGTQDLDRITASLRAFDVEWDRSQWNQVLEAAEGEKLP